jgi:alginate O-acetyltransferase complex protein AlgI
LTLLNILVFVLAALSVAILTRGRGRGMLLLIGSLLAVYWMQPPTPIRHLDFWLPTFTLFLAILVWAVTRPGLLPLSKTDLGTCLLIAGIILAIGLERYLWPICCLTPTIPPALYQILLAVGFSALLTFGIARFLPGKISPINGFIIFILALFVVMKTEPLSKATSILLRSWIGQPGKMASALDLRWLGFSYVAFRLIHTLRDRLAGRLPEYSLQEYLIYIIFFPTFTAGPIDRIQRFVKDLRQPFAISASDIFDGGKRIILGIFNKFVLADSLALIALNETNAIQTHSSGWLWVLLYAYAFRIYLDFSGYTDIAIGLGRLMGIRLPENFEQPYRKPNLTVFWNSWHITLAQWFRAYYFNPLTRAMRSGKRKIPMPAIIFTGQLSTMLLIGLWHGVTWNFAAWGLWHGLGLFIHNRWVEAMRVRLVGLDERPRLKRGLELVGVLLTFHYVTLGWVWFALPSPALSWQVFLKLFGLS